MSTKKKKVHKAKPVKKQQFLHNKNQIFLIILLALIPILTITSLAQKSLTFDELTHIPSGYSYWKTADFRLNEEHPPLIKMLASIPLLFMQVNSEFESEFWNQDDQWNYGWNFFYNLNSQNYNSLVFWARLPTVLLSMLLGFYLFRFTKKLFNEKAAFIALILYVFSPNILAHSRLVTTDIGFICFGFISIYYFWAYLRDSNKYDALKTGIFLGLSLASKYTAVFLIPILCIIFLTFYFDKINLQKIKIKNDYFLMALAALFVISLPYFIIKFPVFLKGILGVIGFSNLGRWGYLFGEHSQLGWWYYFFVGFLLKSTLGFLILVIVSFLILLRYKKLRTRQLAVIFVPIIIIFTVFMFNKINIGVRHILMVYPFFFMFVGGMTIHAYSRIKGNVFKYTLILLIGWHVISSLAAFPNYISYFNEIAGNNPQNYLIDSNIDWGQDLKLLKRYMDENNFDKTVYLSYFGNDNEKLMGLDFERVQCSKRPGINIISINYLEGITPQIARCHSWLKEYNPIQKIGGSIFVYDIP